MTTLWHFVYSVLKYICIQNTFAFTRVYIIIISFLFPFELLSTYIFVAYIFRGKTLYAVSRCLSHKTSVMFSRRRRRRRCMLNIRMYWSRTPIEGSPAPHDRYGHCTWRQGGNSRLSWFDSTLGRVRRLESGLHLTPARKFWKRPCAGGHVSNSF